MKKRLFLTGSLLLVSMALAVTSPAQEIKRAKTITTKGLIDKKSTFNPASLDSLLKCDDYVMLISSFEGCNPCEWLRVSDVFERYPITPYYTDMGLNATNLTVPRTFIVSGFPTCMFFDRSGEIVAVTKGVANYYAKLDSIVNKKLPLCEQEIDGLAADQVLPFMNLMHKANIADLRGDMESVYKYASEAMEIHPGFYNRYLLYKYYMSKGDAATAEKYKQLALDNEAPMDQYIYEDLLKEWKGEK